MPNPIVQFASKLATIIVTFGRIVLASAVVALFAARAWGGVSRPKRQIIYTVVGFVGIVIGALVTQWRLRHIG